MKKIIIGTALCLVLSLVISYIQGFNIGMDIVSTLYTVSGIMFSIGMSLTVISNTSGVKNKKIRLGIRREIKRVRNNFMFCFIIATLLYILLMPWVSNDTNEECVICFFNGLIKFNASYFLIIYMLYSVLYFIVNFISIQSLNEQIEEELNK